MKKELHVKEGFDTVKTFRRIKTKISLEMKDLSSEQIMARLAAASKEFEVKFGDNRVESRNYSSILFALLSLLFFLGVMAPFFMYSEIPHVVISAGDSNFMLCALFFVL